MQILTVSGLQKTYTTRFGSSKVQALKNVNFTVESGEYVAIMGESGSGKTTLLNILAALDKPTGGTVLLGGKNLSEIPEETAAAFRRDNLGFVFQDFSLLDTFSLEDNICLPLVLAGKSRTEMRDRLSPLAYDLGIETLLKKYPYEVSGGQKQRAAVARALITRPQILLADEPTGALDSRSTDELLKLFGEINASGQTIVMVTHSVRAASCASRVLFLRDGEVSLELKRGKDTDSKFYQRITDALTQQQTGGELRMKPTFYPRLAWMGIKKNARLYVPYLLSCAFMAAMLYVIAYLAVTPALYTVNGKVNGSGTSAVAMTMSLGSFVVSVFIALFLFYTNSFLLRRRKKEFGLYSVLGMDRGALSAILFWETLLAAAFTLIAGLGLGLLLSYVSQSALLRLLSLPAAAFHREPCRHQAVRHHVHRHLRAALCARCAVAAPRTGRGAFEERNVGEKPPKSQWLLVIPGLALLLGAYYIAATINDPVQAMLLFFLAVIMVILSTYLLFISGSVTLCKTLQKDEKFYYKKRNFVSLSSLTYRMKRNGAGLASICILSTMVLVMLASTASLYFGAEDAINTLAVQNHWHPTEMADVRAEFFSLYGSLFFLGILLSVLFLFATLLMLYYKQVVEGYEDASRFAIMQRVGMTKRDIRESVNAQMLLIFLLPLAAAALHLAFAQPMIWQIMQLFGIQNLTLFLGVTGAALLLFALLYCAMYRLTSNAYFRIVSTGGAAA